MDIERRQLLERVAELYYLKRLTQQQIAIQTGYSRSMISRLITEANNSGVVEIQINFSHQRRLDLEHKLVEFLGIQKARVLAERSLDYQEILNCLGEIAAQLFKEFLIDNMTIGTSWGTGVYATVRAMHPGPYQGIKVIQTIGSLGTPNPQIDGPELARQLADKLLGQYFTLPVPLFVDSESTRDALYNTPHVKKTLDSFKDISIALVGIGTVNPTKASLLRAGYLNVHQLDELRLAGAVGDVCAIHFDEKGQLVDTPLTRCIVGIDADTLRRIPVKIGVAASVVKACAIIGASRAKLINILVTDESAALEILKFL